MSETALTKSSDGGTASAPIEADASLDTGLPGSASRLGQLIAVILAAELFIIGYFPGAGFAAFLFLLLALATLKYRNSNAYFLGSLALAAVFLTLEHADLISVSLALGFIGLYALDRAGKLPDGDLKICSHFCRTYLIGPFLAPFGIVAASRQATQSISSSRNLVGSVLQWVGPLFLVTVFLVLFFPANPWIALSFEALNPSHWLDLPSGGTLFVWLLVGLLVWPLLVVDFGQRENKPQPHSLSATDFGIPPFAGSLKISLVLFNAVFLTQNAADFTSLWPVILGADPSTSLLPAGMTYSDYARSGAISLLFATILAAIIILYVLRDNQQSRPNRIETILILLWVGQTLLLLGSAAVRLDLYVEAYGLTRLRLGAFIGMGLIGCGLALVIWRISAGKTNAWLIRRMVLIAFTVLFGCGTVNLDGFIADRNISRAISSEKTGERREIDKSYLCYLGSGALPKLAELVQRLEMDGQESNSLHRCLDEQRTHLISRQANWQSWTWRGKRMLEQSNALLPPRGIKLESLNGGEFRVPLRENSKPKGWSLPEE